MTVTWADGAVARLLDTAHCPACGADALRNHRCDACGADYAGPVGAELWDASQRAAHALRARQAVLARIPRVPARAPLPQTTAPAAMPTPAPLGPSGPSATVQSVLAVAGAGLVAVAAIVFTFLNPDLTDTALRSVIVGVVTVAFLAGAVLLSRRALRFSAESVGALGMVFLGLDVQALSELAPPGVSPWVFAAIGTAVAGTVMAALGVRVGIRSWLWLALLALSAVPLMLGAAGSTAATTALGALGTGFAAFALVEATRPVARRTGVPLQADRVALTVVQVLAVPLAIGFGANTGLAWAASWFTLAGVLGGLTVLALFAARQLLPGTWSLLAGALGTAAAVALMAALVPPGGHASLLWVVLVQPAAALLAVLLLGAVLLRLRPVARRLRPALLLSGAFTIAGAVALPAGALTLATGAFTVLAEGAPLTALDMLATVAGLVVAGALLALFALTTRDGVVGVRTGWTGRLAGWFAFAAVLLFACWEGLPSWGRVAVAVGAAAAASVALITVPRARAATAASRLPVIVGAHLALLLGLIVSWRQDDLVVVAGVAVLAALIPVAHMIPRGARFVHVGIGYAYALAVFARGLALVGVDPVAVLCLTTSLAAVGAIVATFVPAVRARAWWAVLAVTAVPFLAGVVQVVFERSGWTALSTGLIFLLALALLLTRRPGLGVVLRTAAAAILVPSLAVVVVCLGAQVLVDSGSPVVLPVIAALVAVVLPTTGLMRAALVRQGLGDRDATAARHAIESSSLVTGAIAVGLGLAREAAGLGTTFLVLLALGVGAAAMALQRDRRYGWWISAAAFTGALWCQWGLAGVDVVEPYLLPPAVAAVAVGAVLTARSRRAVPLYAAGLGLGILPVLALLAATGTPSDIPWRSFGLLGAAWLLVAVGRGLRRASLAPLRLPTLVGAVVAGAAGAVQGVRLGTGLDAAAATQAVPLVLVCASLSLLGAVAALVAARGIVRHAASGSRLAHTRWLTAPATLYLAAGTWTAIERDWFTIWAMWGLLVAYLAAMVAVSWRLRAGRTTLPPVWFVFAIAFTTAVVAWSPRDLRVEWFSLPLGVALLTAGALHLRRTGAEAAGAVPRRTLDAWPAGFTGSWWLLAPGLMVLLSASVTATFTDPLTWRAILVIVIALLAILVGSTLKLAAPFLIGVVVLPIENALAFLVQIGRGIESMPWWITLAVVGAVLLIIAVTYERRAAGDAGLSARLRDLA